MAWKGFIGAGDEIERWEWRRPPFFEILYLSNTIPISTKFSALQYFDILMLECEIGL